MIHVPEDIFLESFREGAALIDLDGKVHKMNSCLANRVGSSGEGRMCHEVLARRPIPCSFCTFFKRGEDVVSADPILSHIDVREGGRCAVSVRPLSGICGTGRILETVKYATDEEQECCDRAEGTDETVQQLLKKLTGLLLISRDLMGNSTFKEKMLKVLLHAGDALHDPAGSKVWADVDDQLYGERPQEIRGPVSVHEIKAEGETRGWLYANSPEQTKVLQEDDYFLEEAADLIGRQIAIRDLELMLRQSEERYRKLARNLTKEVWTRTEALAKETGYLEGILRSSGDMIITTDLESRIVQFNPGAERILGYTAEEIHGRPVSDIWIDTEEREWLLEEVMRTGGIRNYETKLRAKSGHIVEISLTLSLLKDESGKILGTVGVSKDIGRENAIRRELERLNQNYMETIHFISHENKNSLIVIGGFVRRLLETEQNPVRKEQLQIVYHHSKFLEAMSRDFLLLAELEHAEFQVRKEPIEDFYQEVILPAMIGLKERYPDSFHTYDATMGGVGRIRLMGSASLLEVVYRNLFGNALKYRYPHGRIAYGVVEREDSYLFNVWNQGAGVAEDQREKIFDKFYRVADETTREKRGTGLGLYNIRRIVEAHGGRIWCESRPGEWVNFLFTIPKQ